MEIGLELSGGDQNYIVGDPFQTGHSRTLMKKYISAQAVITSPEISNVSRHWRESLRGESFSE